MDMKVVLRRIASRLKQLGVTEAAISRAATSSPDTIRNWRRRVERGEKPGASTVTLGPVAAALGVTRAWLEGEGPEDFEQVSEVEARRARLLEVFDSLDPQLQAVAERQIAALAPEEAPLPSSNSLKKARGRAR